NSFADWVSDEKYRDAYFMNPERMSPKLPLYLKAVAHRVVHQSQTASADKNTVVAILGVASLFGFAQASDLIPKIICELPSRLLIFFPGSNEGNVYRLLDAREGWNYLATPITGYENGGTT